MTSAKNIRSYSWWIVCGAGVGLLTAGLLLMNSTRPRESKAERLFKRFVLPQIPSSVTNLQQEGFVGFNDFFICFKFNINTNDQFKLVEQLGLGGSTRAEEPELRYRFEQITKSFPETKMNMPTNLADGWVEHRSKEKRVSQFLYYKETDGLALLFLYGQ
jgi:hypothetical protein